MIYHSCSNGMYDSCGCKTSSREVLKQILQRNITKNRRSEWVSAGPPNVAFSLFAKLNYCLIQSKLHKTVRVFRTQLNISVAGSMLRNIHKL